MEQNALVMERYVLGTEHFALLRTEPFVRFGLGFNFPNIFRFPRTANQPFVYLRYGKMRIKVYLIQLDPLVFV